MRARAKTKTSFPKLDTSGGNTKVLFTKFFGPGFRKILMFLFFFFCPDIICLRPAHKSIKAKIFLGRILFSNRKHGTNGKYNGEYGQNGGNGTSGKMAEMAEMAYSFRMLKLKRFGVRVAE